MRIFIYLTALVFSAGCASAPKEVEQPASQLAVAMATASVIPDKPVDVWLMPIEGFPPEFANELAQKFSAELGLNVRATVHVGRSPKMFGPSGQMIAEDVRDELKVPLHRLYDVTPKTIL